MKKKIISDKTFCTDITFIWDCSLEELRKYITKLGYDAKVGETIGTSVGETIMEKDNVLIWLKNEKDCPAVAHEILHAIRYWLQDYYGINLIEENEEIYAMLHSFYMEEILKVINNKKQIYGKNNSKTTKN